MDTSENQKGMVVLSFGEVTDILQNDGSTWYKSFAHAKGVQKLIFTWLFTRLFRSTAMEKLDNWFYYKNNIMHWKKIDSCLNKLQKSCKKIAVGASVNKT